MKNSDDGKIYIIYTTTEVSEGCTLKNVSKDIFWDIPCIKGTQCGEHWGMGKTLYIPIEKISMIVEIESEKEYQEIAHKYEESERRKIQEKNIKTQ